MKNEHKFFLDIAEKVSQQSTCCRLQVGCVLVRKGRIISIGYNGVPKGMQHCEDVFKFKKVQDDYEEFRKEHHEWSNNHELHAEANAILFAAKEGISTNGATLYITYSPCINCAKIIASAGIAKVVYGEQYDRSSDGIDFLEDLGIPCLTADEAEKITEKARKVEHLTKVQTELKGVVDNINKVIIHKPKLYMIDKDGNQTPFQPIEHLHEETELLD